MPTLFQEGFWTILPNRAQQQYDRSTIDLQKLNLKVAHGGVSLEKGKRRQTTCEWDVWYSIVARMDPPAGTKVFAQDEPIHLFAQEYFPVSTGPFDINCYLD
ncbi:MAG: hypothetical protein GY947_18920 [Rhodobacteraceae bacterium]|nr:hypothetical protein [Paracoccaceae bacterium]